MPDPFPRSLRVLNRTSSGKSWWMPLTLTGFLGAWLLWFLLARVTLYAVSTSARLEVEQAACPIEASVGGRVTATHIELGAEVREGDALLELDADALRLERDELLATRAGREAELGPLGDEIAALGRQLDDMGQAAIMGAEELAAEIREEEAALRLANDVVERSTKLESKGVVSEFELARARSDVETHRAALERDRAAKDRLEWDRRAQTSELQAKVADSRHREARVRTERSIVDASIERLAHEIGLRTIRAPVSGRLGETANFRVGQFVAEGTRLAAVVPAGGIKIVADFRPQDALGRIRSGQSARFRLDGFPWTQYGFVPCRVTTPASEALSGTARVESSIPRDLEFPVALQHGWPGTLEIEIGRVSPATLVLRASGALIAGGSRRTDTAEAPAVER